MHPYESVLRNLLSILTASKHAVGYLIRACRMPVNQCIKGPFITSLEALDKLPVV